MIKFQYRQGLAVVVFLVMIMAGLPAFAQDKNLIAVAGGMASPSNGSGWITDHLETGWVASIEYARKRESRLGFYINARLLDHEVDTSGTTEEDESVSTSTYGLGGGLRYWILDKEKYDLFAGAGAGLYSSELKAGSSTEDTSSGTGLDFNLGASVNLSTRIYINARVDYLMLFLGEGASFDDLALSAGLGFGF